jgi:hypothetical protein
MPVASGKPNPPPSDRLGSWMVNLTHSPRGNDDRYLRIPAKDPRRFGSPSGRRSNRVRFSPLGVPESLKSSEQHLLFVVRHLIEDIHIRFELPALACPSLDREWRLPLQLEQRKARGRYS